MEGRAVATRVLVTIFFALAMLVVPRAEAGDSVPADAEEVAVAAFSIVTQSEAAPGGRDACGRDPAPTTTENPNGEAGDTGTALFIHHLTDEMARLNLDQERETLAREGCTIDQPRKAGTSTRVDF